ncbi:hypothetical protein AAVH_22318 [Aphelenchoides avenae]|nr:hypothetical protein AAVH_22318 [Aphelenchus avenae]
MPSIPFSIVSNNQFRRLIYGFDKRYKMPKSHYGAICMLARHGERDASEAVFDAESAGADDDDYEKTMLRKRKVEKRLSSEH